MPLSDAEQQALVQALEQDGWLRQGPFIHAPRRSIWLHTGSWPGGLRDLLAAMCARLGRIHGSAGSVEDEDEHEAARSDTSSLVRALQRLLNEGS